MRLPGRGAVRVPAAPLQYGGTEGRRSGFCHVQFSVGNDCADQCLYHVWNSGNRNRGRDWNAAADSPLLAVAPASGRDVRHGSDSERIIQDAVQVQKGKAGTGISCRGAEAAGRAVA